MQARVTARPEQDVIAAIQGLDLESVKLRVMDPELGKGWTREYADSIEAEYKDFLTLVVKYQAQAEDILLSKDVDEFWHTHILHTMKYTEDCERLFGKYLHHHPQVGRQSRADIERRAAMCSVAIRAEDAAMCSVAVRAKDAAMCSVAVRPEEVAMCSVAIRAEDAAMCSVGIRPGDAAMCSVAIRAKDAAMCSVAIRAVDAAMCSVAIPPQRAAVLGAAAQANKSTRAMSAAA